MNGYPGTILPRAGVSLLALLIITACGGGNSQAQKIRTPNCSTASSNSTPEEARPPNIIFISVEDMNDWVTPLNGHPDTVTPNIAKLASRGMNFRNAHTASPACQPSRVALLTGRHPRRTGVVTNNDFPMRDYLPNAVTIFQHFAQNGYYVAAAGKLFHSTDNLTEPWEEYTVNRGHGQPDTFPSHGLTALIDEFHDIFDWGPAGADMSEWGDYKTASYAEAFLTRDCAAPFFLALGLRSPHLPWYFPDNAGDRVREIPELPAFLQGDRDDMPPSALRVSTRAHEIISTAGKWEEAIHAYLATISFIDDQVGRIINALDGSTYKNDTILVLWSDHGWHLGEKSAWQKFTLWEESTRVPLIIVAPEITVAGEESIQVVSLIDLYPTLIELAGVPPRQGLDGVSIVSILRDPKAATVNREFIVTSRGEADSLRSDRWRFTHYGDNDEELYDHAADPNEFTNLINDPGYAEIAADLRIKLENAYR